MFQQLRSLLGGDRLAESVRLAEVEQRLEQEVATNELFVERLAELELALEDSAWTRLTGEGNNDFSRTALHKITRKARLYWLHNPLIKQGVRVKRDYVFGQGVNIAGRDKVINEVIQAFLADEKNEKELTAHAAMQEQEDALQVDANLFFCFFTNRTTGATRVRSIPFSEIEDVITNPDDAKEPWYYKRVRVKRLVDLASGVEKTKQEISYYPDWRYKPRGGRGVVRAIGGNPVHWDRPVYHVAVNKLPDMKFGVSEVYAALDWAKAYKQFLENWATIVASYARFAWKATTKGGAKGVATTKAKLGTALAADSRETNPAPAAGSAAIMTAGQDLQPIRTAGATTSAEDGRRLLLMVCSGFGIYEHYFGDPGTGNLATAKSMERPMELMFLGRQTFWRTVFMNILWYVIEQAALAPAGKLAGMATPKLNEYGEQVLAWGATDTHIDIDFQDLLEKDVKAHIEAIISAGTLDGKTPAGLDLKTMTKMLLVALGEDDVDAMIDQLFPEGWEEARAKRAAELAKVAQAGMAKQDEDDEDEETPEDAREAKVFEGINTAVLNLTEALRELKDAQRAA